jgi:LPXTG-site transpeptidase (sortase) family protein
MTVVEQSAPETPESPETQAHQPAPQKSPVRKAIATALLILSGSLLGFTLYIGLVSQLHYFRAQHVAYADFRVPLAQATAPVGPTDPLNPKALLTMGAPVAVLDIPEIEQHDVVFEGTTGGVLENGPGHLRDTVLPGQAGVSEIFGRAAAYGGPFGKLAQLSPGDKFTAITGQGVATYRVIDVRRPGDREPPYVTGTGRLILATANGSPFLPSDVLRVDAQLTSAAQPAPRQLPSNYVSDAEAPLAIDSTAWFPLVIWLQGLVVAAVLITWARTRWGRWQVWIVAVPVIGFFGLSVADQVARLLLNLT